MPVAEMPQPRPERKQLMTLNLKDDVRLMDWLLSNPVGEVYSLNNPVIGVEYETFRKTRRGDVRPDASGFRRWPIVPDRPEPTR